MLTRVVGGVVTMGLDVRAARRWVKARVYWLWNGGPPDDDFDHIASLLKKRNRTLETAMADLTKAFGTAGTTMDAKVVFQLAAVDLFVEKAQAVLTARARRMSRAGLAASSVAVAALTSLSFYIVTHAGEMADGQNLDLNTLILRIVTAISLGAVVLVAVKYLISLARSFFHESVTLLSRRHALRFGRMYLYLNASDSAGEIDLKELRKAFDWNRGGDSSFLDIKPEEIGKTPWSVLAKGLGDSLEKGIEKGIEKASEQIANRAAPQSRDEAVDGAALPQR